MKINSKNLLIKTLKIAWVIIWIIILIVALYSYNSTHQPETVLSAWISMFYLSFPISLVTSVWLIGMDKIYTMVGLSEGYNVYPLLGYFDIFIIWLLSVVLGYLQWFVFLPFIVTLIKSGKLIQKKDVSELENINEKNV